MDRTWIGNFTNGCFTKCCFSIYFCQPFLFASHGFFSNNQQAQLQLFPFRSNTRRMRILWCPRKPQFTLILNTFQTPAKRYVLLMQISFYSFPDEQPQCNHLFSLIDSNEFQFVSCIIDMLSNLEPVTNDNMVDVFFLPIRAWITSGTSM